jgi:hypothetical protein
MSRRRTSSKRPRQPLRWDGLSTRRTSRRSCSPSADGVTGETVVVDGARAITQPSPPCHFALAEQHDEWAVARRYSESLTTAHRHLIDGDANE